MVQVSANVLVVINECCLQDCSFSIATEIRYSTTSIFILSLIYCPGWGNMITY